MIISFILVTFMCECKEKLDVSDFQGSNGQALTAAIMSWWSSASDDINGLSMFFKVQLLTATFLWYFGKAPMLSTKHFLFVSQVTLMLFWSSAPRVRNTLQKLSRFLSFCHAEISYSFLDLSATLKKKKSFTGSKSLAMFVLILQDKNC